MAARAAAGRGRDLQPPEGRAAARDRRHDALRDSATGSSPLTQSELAIDSRYNTRTHGGLPPGPDRQPRRWHRCRRRPPRQDRYLYYVARRRQRGHSFSAPPSSSTRRARAEARGGSGRDDAPTRIGRDHRVARSSTPCSPAMHNAAFGALGLDWAYEAFPVEPGRVAEAVRGLARPAARGSTSRSPTSRRARPLLVESRRPCDGIGAANTLCRTGTGASGRTTPTWRASFAPWTSRRRSTSRA